MTPRSQRLLILIAFVIAIGIYVVIPNSPGIHIAGINKDFETRWGLDLVGGVQALLEADLPPETPIEAGAMGAAVNIVENRVNALGVTEAVVQQAGDRRIVVEIPGETDPEKALATLKQTGLLEFVDFSGLTTDQIAELFLVAIKTDFAGTPSAPPTVEPTSVITATTEVTATETTTSSVSALANRVFDTIMTGADLRTVNVTTDQTGKYQIAFELSSEGAKIFDEYTSTHIGQPLAIVLDKRIISVPYVKDPIRDGRGVISGNFDYEEANSLAIQLRYGSLPIPLKIVENRTVGPTLGQDSLRKSLVAGAIGFVIVFLFMSLYYRLPGLVANLAIVIYAILAFAIFRAIPVTITLPGVAGFLLSTGSALDANILIFERMKEEIRSGKTLRQSLELGWKRAWPSIRDSNIATLITCLILFWFGSTFGATVVKGFSITLALGVMVSLFTALVVTRVLLDLVLAYFKSTNLAKWFGI